MKTVLHIKDNTPVIEMVPDNWLQCSISFEYRPPEEFRNEGDQFQTRTNCTRTYKMRMAEMEALITSVREIISGDKYKSLANYFAEKNSYMGASISVQEMIDELLKLNPSDRLLVTQDGYYAEGDLACVFEPELKKTIDSVNFYSIGHSSQNY